jgi:long-chain fatty acid transport protein
LIAKRSLGGSLVKLFSVGGLVVAGVLVLAPAPEARATGIVVARFGGEHGTPASANTTAMYYNPAMLGSLRGTNLYVEGSFALRMVTYDRPVGAIDNPNQMPGTPDPATNSGEATLSNLLISPYIGVSSDFGIPNLGVAVGFYTPFGGQAEWDKNEDFEGNDTYPGAVDGAQRWHNIEGVIRSSYITAAAGYKLPFGLSVGVGANVVLSVVDTIRARNSDGSDDTSQEDGSLLEGRALADVKGTTFSLGVGIAYEPNPNLTIGLSYQSQPNFGEMTMKGDLTLKLGALPSSTTDVDFTQSLPDIIRLGVRYRPMQTLELRLWGSFERWSLLTDTCFLDQSFEDRRCEVNEANGVPVGEGTGIINNIPRHWEDSFSLRASGSYWLNPDLELQVGLGFDGNAVPDKTQEASLPDWNDITATVGANVGLLGGKMQLQASFLAVFSIPRTVDPAPPPYMPPSRVPDGAGEYKQFVGVLQVGVGYKF